MKKIKALFASAYPMLLCGFLSFFSDDPLIDLDSKRFICLTEINKIEKTDFDVIILDDELLNYCEQEKFNEVFPYNNDLRKIIYVKSKGISYIKKMISYSTDGIVSKNSENGRLREAIIKVSKREKYFCDNIWRIINKHEEHYNLLTHREKEILNCLEEGLTNKEISERLNISYRTVENHKVSICQKFELPGRKDLLKYILNG